jgi:hypothetical protein
VCSSDLSNLSTKFDKKDNEDEKQSNS